MSLALSTTSLTMAMVLKFGADVHIFMNDESYDERIRDWWIHRRLHVCLAIRKMDGWVGKLGLLLCSIVAFSWYDTIIKYTSFSHLFIGIGPHYVLDERFHPLVTTRNIDQAKNVFPRKTPARDGLACIQIPVILGSDGL